jgi:hypothetical protein
MFDEVLFFEPSKRPGDSAFINLKFLCDFCGGLVAALDRI